MEGTPPPQGWKAHQLKGQDLNLADMDDPDCLILDGSPRNSPFELFAPNSRQRAPDHESSPREAYNNPYWTPMTSASIRTGFVIQLPRFDPLKHLPFQSPHEDIAGSHNSTNKGK